MLSWGYSSGGLFASDRQDESREKDWVPKIPFKGTLPTVFFQLGPSL